ncbi:hypothetical protein D9611_009644 [Ephemerocybe angulata]|uniref:GH16 domain-containing protein n=1 Tax=Ephemerocybe angulata TaxID=980116 RepID=A0A8H5C5Q3_9AGAR|nr:hypothetical protein D9611_009644 [Tulosesus angulatus]
MRFSSAVFTSFVLSLLTLFTFQAIPSTHALCTPKTYKMADDIKGAGFFDAFDFEAIDDPTHGRVNYVDGETAKRNNLTFGSGETFILRPDTVSILKPDGPGRDSVRLISKKNYTNHVAVFDIRHMPQGCGTWPAVWEVDPTNWPFGGEFDILEGANDDGPNASTLHTGPGCVMPAGRSGMLGKQLDENCDSTINNNIGCPVKFQQPESYGPAFNGNGGGWYAVERTPAAIKVWFWGRNDNNVPAQVRNGDANVAPETWGTPTALFPENNCNIDQHFAAHNIIINLTLCGDWAGQTYGSTGCPSTCVDFVNNNPKSFEQAYFDFASLRVYL